MKKKTAPKTETYSKYGTLKFDSVRTFISPKGHLFYCFKIGNNSLWVAENLLTAVKKQAA